jgi:hypothetical protein
MKGKGVNHIGSRFGNGAFSSYEGLNGVSNLSVALREEGLYKPSEKGFVFQLERRWFGL